jgi:hypothetical protein
MFSTTNNSKIIGTTAHNEIEGRNKKVLTNHIKTLTDKILDINRCKPKTTSLTKRKEHSPYCSSNIKSLFNNRLFGFNTHTTISSLLFKVGLSKKKMQINKNELVFNKIASCSNNKKKTKMKCNKNTLVLHK